MGTIRILALLGTGLFLMACDSSFRGTLRVDEPIALQVKEGRIDIPAGRYNGKVQVKSAHAELEIVQANKKKVKVHLPLPKGHKIKSFQQLDLSAAASGQAYRFKGEQSSESSTQYNISATESCSITEREYRCSENKEGENVCGNVDISIPGTQDVTYDLTTIGTTRRILLIDEAQIKTVAVFSNYGTSESKRYTYEGTCRRDWSSSPW